jgi:hypothetical protein
MVIDRLNAVAIGGAALAPIGCRAFAIDRRPDRRRHSHCK